MNTRHTSTEPTTRKSIKPYGIFAVCIVPVYTMLFACQGHLITTNLSQLGNRPGHHGRFILWGVLVSAVFFALFSRVMEMAQYRSIVGKGVLLTACLSFLVCVLLPFVPDKYPRAAHWHNELAMFAAVLTAALSAMVALHLRKVDRSLCIQSLLLWGAQVSLCMFLLRTTGISGLVEAVFIATTCLYAFQIMVQLNKLPGVTDAESVPPEGVDARSVQNV